MKSYSILVVEDDALCQKALGRILEAEGYHVTITESARAAVELCRKENFAVLICDLRLPDGDGIQVMESCQSIIPELPCIFLTGFASLHTAVEATKKGAFDFLQKPFDNNHLTVVIRNAIQQFLLKKQNRNLKKMNESILPYHKMIGSSPQMKKLFEVIEKVSDTDSTILIRGESGTGKELIARAIHQRSRRADHLLVPMNCGAIPRDLLESELFGHMKGAFTGAVSNRTGRFEVADGGTLFLDEIGEMSPPLQVKLLRVLQEHSFEPIGSTKTIHVDVRIIAATNQNLEKMIDEKKFREDLFYRLNVIPLYAPPLRERRSDIRPLCDHFLKTFNATKNKHVEGIDEASLYLMENYDWPGNVRELENLIERMVILKSEGVITLDDLPEKIRSSPKLPVLQPQSFELPTSGVSFNDLVNDFENHLITQALTRTGWNRNQAAKLLGLNRTTLVEKLKKKGLNPLEQKI